MNKTLSQSDVKVAQIKYRAERLANTICLNHGFYHHKPQVQKLIEDELLAVITADAQEAAQGVGAIVNCPFCGANKGEQHSSMCGLYKPAQPQPEQRPDGIMLNEKAEMTCGKQPEIGDARDLAVSLLEYFDNYKLATITPIICEIEKFSARIRAETIEQCAKVAETTPTLFVEVRGALSALPEIAAKQQEISAAGIAVRKEAAFNIRALKDPT